MSVVSQSSRRTDGPLLVDAEAQKMKVKNGIQIDLSKLEEYGGIKPDAVIVCDWLRDKSLRPVSADDLIEQQICLKKNHFEGKPPISMTFKFAVQFVVDLINENAKFADQDGAISCHCPATDSESVYAALFSAIANSETPRPDLIPSPPQYGGLICSAVPTDTRYWMGAIISMLYTKGHVTSFGRSGVCFWVKR